MNYASVVKRFAIAKLRKKPFYSLFICNSKCNLRCPSCVIWKPSSQKWRDMATKEALEAVGFLLDLGVCYIGFSGGEPSMRRDLPRLVRRASSVVTGITTNGTGRFSFYDRCFRSGLYKASFSVDGSSSELHDSLRGKKGVFGKAVTNIEKLSNKGYNLEINTVVSSLNYHDVDNIIKKFGELGIKVNLLSLTNDAWYFVHKIPPINLPEEEVRARIRSWRKWDNVFLTKSYSEVLFNALYGKYSVICKPFSTIIMHPDGRVSFCTSSQLISHFSDFSLKEYKQSAKEFISSCNGCASACFYNFSSRSNVFSKIKEYF
jgi:MoaA/NifB/PqqE/SkfB family radical SAM enzyme